MSKLTAHEIKEAFEWVDMQANANKHARVVREIVISLTEQLQALRGTVQQSEVIIGPKGEILFKEANDVDGST